MARQKKSVLYLQDSEDNKRQRKSCLEFAEHNGYNIIKEFSDPSVGKIAVLSRNGFKKLYRFCREKSVENIIFENVNRVAQDELEMEIASRFLKEQGLNLHPACPDIGFESSIGSKPTQQMIEVFDELEKSKVALRLQGGRISKSLVNKQKGLLVLNGKRGKVAGRKSYKELDADLVDLARKLRRKNWKTGKRRSLQKITDLLYEQGYGNSKGNPYGTGEISRMLRQ